MSNIEAAYPFFIMNVIVTLVFCFSLSATLADRDFIRVTNSETWKYIIRDEKQSFNNAVNWCHAFGGNLPIIHTQADFDYLLDTVILSNKPAFDRTWLGLARIGGSCTTWMDGSLRDYTFTWDTTNGGDVCPSVSVALKVWHGGDNNHKKVFWGNTDPGSEDQGGRAVCVLKVPSRNEIIFFQRRVDETNLAVDNRIEQLDETNLAVDKRIKQLDETYSAVDERIEQLDETYSVVDKRIKQLEEENAKGLKIMSDRISRNQLEASQSIGNFNRVVIQQSVETKRVMEQMQEIEKFVKQWTHELSTKISLNMQEINNLRNHQNHGSERIEKLNSSLSEKIEMDNKSFNDTRQELNDLSAKSDESLALKNEMIEVEQRMKQLDDRINDSKSSVTISSYLVYSFLVVLVIGMIAIGLALKRLSIGRKKSETDHVIEYSARLSNVKIVSNT